MTVSIISVNYNETNATAAMLDSIRRQAFHDVEVIVVDNGSRDDPGEVLKSCYPGLIYLRSEQNLGFAGGNNLALPLAKGDVLFFLNNDAVLEPDTIDVMIRFMSHHPNAGLLSPLIYYFSSQPEAEPIIQYAGMTAVSPVTGRNRSLGAREPDQGRYVKPAQTAYAHGAAMMIPRKVLEQAGPMWEGFFLYYEELDWAERIKKAGYEIWIVPGARVWHKESLTIGKMGATKTFYLTRNRIWFMRRNFNGAYYVVFFLFLMLVTAPKNALSLIFKAEWLALSAFLKGIFAGLTKPRMQHLTQI